MLVGATAPGVPFLVLGHNGHIAWTFTTTGADMQDLFIETPAGADDYMTPDGPRPFTVRHEVIHVRGAPDETADGAGNPARPGDQRPAGAGRGRSWPAAMANLAPGDTAAEGLLALNRADDVRGGRARRRR